MIAPFAGDPSDHPSSKTLRLTPPHSRPRKSAMQTTPYLYFKGSCEAALHFYEACGLGTIKELRRYEGTPLAERDGPEWREKIIHSVFEGPGLRLCASDGPDSEPMKGCALFLELDEPAAAGKLFDALSAEGRVTVPYKLQFWGDHYGNFTDKFGVQWAVSSAAKRLRRLERACYAHRSGGISFRTEATMHARAMTMGDILDGKYRVLGVLGKGGMGAVYSAIRLALGDHVAVKVLLESQEGDVGRARFLREARAAARIRHPSVVQVFDYGDPAGGAPYIVMELLEGPTLGEEIAAHGRLSVERALSIFADVCSAVEAGHRRGVVHRDLKPGNVILSRTDDGGELVKVLDFGIAQLAGQVDQKTLTTPGSLVGTCAYMAPEQVNATETGPTSDVFALGVMLYEMLTGALPFEAPSAIGMMMRIVAGEHTPIAQHVAGLPPTLVQALESAFSVDPRGRPPSPEAFAGLVGARDAVSPPTARGELPSLLEEDIRKKSGAALRASWDATVLDHATPDMTRFVGRVQELARIEEQLRAAAAGEGRLVVVTGDAGVGKSRLVEIATRKLAEGGAKVLRASFFEYEGSRLPSCEAIVRMLGLPQTVIEPGPPSSRPGSESDKWRLFSAVADALSSSARETSVVVSFDDLQWASALELELLSYLWHALDSRRVLMFATARPSVAASDLGRWLAAMANRRAIAMIPVRPLSADEVRSWFVETFGAMRVRSQDLRRIDRATGGNPHYLVEVTRHLLSSGAIHRDENGWACIDLDGVALPDTLTSIARAKLDLLPEGVREVLEVASVIGAEMRFATLAEATGWEEEALEKALEHAQSAQIVTDAGVTDGDDYRFTSESLRRVLYDGMSARRRKRTHQKVASAVEALYAKDLRRFARLLCYHHHAVGNADAALSWGLLAAEDDLAAHENDGADASLRRARDAARSLTSAGTPAAAMALARLDRLSGALFARVGKPEDAVQHLERAAQATLGDEAWSLHLDARLDLAVAHVGRGDLPRALAEAERAAEIARSRGETARLLTAETLAASCLMRTGRLEDSRVRLEEAIARAEGKVPAGLLAASLSNLAFLCVKRGAFADGERSARRALALAKDARDPMAQHGALTALAAVYSEAGDAASAVPLLEQTLVIARALSLRRREGIELANLGEAYVGLGRLAAAQEHFRSALAIFVEIQDRACEGDCRVNLGRALLAEGKSSAAIPMLERGLETCEATGRLEYAGLALVSLGEARRLEADVPRAVEALERARAIFVSQGAHHLWTATLGLSRAHLDAGRLDEAKRFAKLAEAELVTLRASLPEAASHTRVDHDLEDVKSVLRALEPDATQIGGT